MPPHPTLASVVRIKENVLFQESDGESVLLNLTSGVYFGLDALGTRIWQLLSDYEVLAEIAGAIVVEYDVSEERCAADLIALVAALEQNGLVTVSERT